MQLLFCGSGWLPIVDAISAGLPDGDSVVIWDRSQPLASAVADVDVILPSNGHIDAEVIAAASKVVLIQQPAAGVDGIDL